MKQKLLIILGLGLLLALLAGLNAASYVQKEKTADNEAYPNRSTYNSGPTGTQAFFSLLSETGRRVERWQRPVGELATVRGDKPAVFVVIGSIRRSFTPDECTDLLRWVANGGRFVLVDRSPEECITATTSSWKISLKQDRRSEVYEADPTEPSSMIGKTVAAKAAQPSVFASGINAVQPSQFASSIQLSRLNDDADGKDGDGSDRPPLRRLPQVDVSEPSSKGPIVLFASEGKNLVVEAPFGRGRIVYVADPYFVTNAGIGLVDNAQLGINLVSVDTGSILFDEYHQGYGDRSQFLQFFAGTPVIAIFLQAAALIAFVFYSQSRRFARPVPEREPDRLSKLEYVSAMSELQQRMRAYDLAMENLYRDFRRRACRLLGLDALTARYDEIARAICERTGVDLETTLNTLFKCEDIMHGEPTNRAEVVRLTSELREIEIKLGLTRWPMTLSTSALVILIVVFLLTSVVGVVTGSNSLVAVPAMFQVGIDARTAIATNMFGLLFMSVGATIPFVRQKRIDYAKVTPFIALTIVASALGALLVGIISGEGLKLIVSTAMIAVALFSLLRHRTGVSDEVVPGRFAKPLTYFFVFLLGVYGGLFSGGYVTILTAVCVGIYGMRYGEAVASTKLINVFSSGIATIVFMWQGLVDYKLGLILGVTMFIGAYFGAHYVTKLNDIWLRRIFLTTVLLLAAKTIYDLTSS